MEKTPLYEQHVELGARIVDFAGWSMPVVYDSINDEHQQVRTRSGLFDISHMGRLILRGPKRVQLLERLLTNHVATLKPGQIRYSLMLNESAGMLDDVLIYRLNDDEHLMVVNASNRQKIVAWINQQDLAGVSFDDQTMQTAMVALQGPESATILKERLGLELGVLKYYFVMQVDLLGERAIMSRTGYTGEDGAELIVANQFAATVWQKLLGSDDACKPIGLGARDTLRLEAAMPLYGHELNETLDPIQARLGWACPLEGKEFVGKSALLRRPADRPVRVGIEVNDRRIAREGYKLVHSGRVVGHVTSGTQAPSLAKSIAMGYIEPTLCEEGTEIAVDIRGTQVPAKIVSLPFYSRNRKTT